ncbi:MAG TPA: 2-oxoacid:acceptor oxidoreductase family protein [Tissierellaceae bacterium]|nr:2-oxoacid:acceptor oxidoreductase family protein [Tissierellaceae bacterium]
MKGKWEIVFSGVGGQGLLLNGNILGKAATIIEKKQAVMRPSYGSETRGTFTKCDLIISEEYIDFPEVTSADVVVALAQVAYDKYVETMKEDSIILYNNNQVKESQSKAKQYGIRMEDIALEAKNQNGVNMVALGALIAKTKCVKPESVKNMLAKQFEGKDEIIKKNEKAFDLGYKELSELL